jgi:hypothetical protein
VQLEPLSPAQASPEEGPPLDYFDLDAWMSGAAGPTVPRDDWAWQILPDGIIYKAYLANPKESRLGTQIFSQKGDGALWDSTLGGRVDLKLPKGSQTDRQLRLKGRGLPGSSPGDQFVVLKIVTPAATTPADGTSRMSRLANAPRVLKEPACCNNSSLSTSGTGPSPKSAPSASTTGVRRI